jgi:quercetin dioxygenase-like cupin family protein
MERFCSPAAALTLSFPYPIVSPVPKKERRKNMSQKKRTALAVLAIGVLAGTAFALANISLTVGSTPVKFDFGGEDGSQPGTVQFHTFTLKPGEVIGWHKHKAVSYVVLERGTLKETHLDEDSQHCISAEFQSGTGFVEGPGELHTVANTGKGAAVITWATVYPTNDPIIQLPQFTAGGIYFATDAPNCN